MSTFLSVICILANNIDTLYNSGKVAASAVMLVRNALSVHIDNVQIGATQGTPGTVNDLKKKNSLKK